MATPEIRMSDQRVRNRLHDTYLYAQLTIRHRREPLQFTQKYQPIKLKELRPILFIDESKSCVDFHDERRRVLRKTNESYNDVCTEEHDIYPTKRNTQVNSLNLS